jgi:hypothetical protein
MKTIFTLCIAALLGIVCTTCQAAVIIVGNHNLAANTPGQTINISVSGGEAVAGMNLDVQIGNTLSSPGVPSITSVNMITGTIFAGNNSGQTDVTTYPQYYNGNIATASGTVPASGLLFTLTVDTTGIFSGSWDLELANTLAELLPPNGISTELVNASGQPFTPAITNGTISIQQVTPPTQVPEPTTLVAWGAVSLVGAAGYWRRRKASR